MKLLALFILSLSFAGCGSSGGGSASAPVPHDAPANSVLFSNANFNTVQYSWHRSEGIFQYAQFGQTGSHEFRHEFNVFTGFNKMQLFLSVKIWHESFERVELFHDPATPNVWKGTDAKGFYFEYLMAGNPAHANYEPGTLKISKKADYYDSHIVNFASNG